MFQAVKGIMSSGEMQGSVQLKSASYCVCRVVYGVPHTCLNLGRARFEKKEEKIETSISSSHPSTSKKDVALADGTKAPQETYSALSCGA